MNRRRATGLQVAALLGLILGMAGPTEAALVFFTDRTSWLAAAGTPTFTEGFESFLVDTPFRAAPVALNGMSIVQEGVSSIADFRNEVDVPPLLDPPPSSKVASLYTNAAEAGSPGTQVRITFNAPGSAFGFDSWINSPAEGATLEVYNGATLLGSQALSNANGAFLGYVLTGGDTATSVRFRSTNLSPGAGGEGFNIDNLAGVTATPIPEPSSIALLASASIAGLGLARRRSRRPAR